MFSCAYKRAGTPPLAPNETKQVKLICFFKFLKNFKYLTQIVLKNKKKLLK